MGSVYALVALGYTMVYGVLRLINFAHGDIMMTGAFSGYFVATAFARSGFLDRDPILAMLAIMAVAVTTSTIIALLTERLAYRPFRHVRGLAPLICAIGVSFFLEQTFRGAFGAGVRAYPTPKWQKGTISVFGSGVPILQIMVVAAALISMAILYVIVQRTKMGTAMRAVSEDADAAALMGIDVDKVVVFTFALGGAMAGIAGVCYGFIFKQVYFYMGFTPGIKAFGAAVLGGIGSVPGAMLGGLFLGIVDIRSFQAGYFYMGFTPASKRSARRARRHRQRSRRDARRPVSRRSSNPSARLSSLTALASPRPINCVTSSPSPSSSWS